MPVVDVIEKALSGTLSWLDAQRVRGYSSRHMRRLRERLEVDGASGLVDRRSGRVMPGRADRAGLAAHDAVGPTR
jgi:hypothetical protein